MKRDFDICVLIAMKRLDQSKGRLSKLLKPEERARLSLLMLEDEAEAVKHLRHVYVVSSDLEIQSHAEKLGLESLNSGDMGLNGDFSWANSLCVKSGADATLFLLGDLPTLTAADLETIISHRRPCAAVISPSNDGGTNALLISPSTLIETRFGEASYAKHKAALRSAGAKIHVYDSPGTRLDIDTYEDIELLLGLKGKLARTPKSLIFLEEIFRR
jgi:2-phospho-L-lactate guanylyltransferase